MVVHSAAWSPMSAAGSCLRTAHTHSGVFDVQHIPVTGLTALICIECRLWRLYMTNPPICVCMLKVSIKPQVILSLGIWSFVCPVPLACACLISMTELQRTSSVKRLVPFYFRVPESADKSCLCFCCSFVRSSLYLRPTSFRCLTCLKKADSLLTPDLQPVRVVLDHQSPDSPC